MRVVDTTKRTVIKTITFKILTTGITAIWTGLGSAIAIHLVLTFVYILHEKGWNKIHWGKKLLTSKEY